MLYITTRNSHELFTSHQAMTKSIAPDGGRFVPLRLPVYESSEIAELSNKGFSQTVAELLNTFFSSHLTGWDVDLALGKYASRLVSMNHRIAISELWHNPDGDYGYIARYLFRLVLGNDTEKCEVSDWFKIAVNIAVIFGIYGELLRTNVLHPELSFDISVPAGDFSMPIAGLYARKMGLPIEMIISTCEDANSIWDLIHRGIFNCSLASEDLLLGVERLIHTSLGTGEVQRYLMKCKKKLTYSVSEDVFNGFADSFFCAVAGESRAATIINSVYRSNSYFIDPHTALCFGGLQDYRAKNGGGRLTLLPALYNPMRFADTIKCATGVSI